MKKNRWHRIQGRYCFGDWSINRHQQRWRLSRNDQALISYRLLKTAKRAAEIADTAWGAQVESILKNLYIKEPQKRQWHS